MKRFYYKDEKGNKFSLKQERKDLTEITEEEFYKEKVFSDEEKAQSKKYLRIAELKQKLKDSDYKVIKYLEGELSLDEYLPIKLERVAWRKEINELEN